ncbi:alpha/beta hydrolase [Cytobacillus sp. FJAT-54145]|uniref:Alpha/beta hydrolase n=1 Tax=Cytobacillus spartinae TaxID=3299023 RepID=A0ABW6KCT1_9BACI
MLEFLSVYMSSFKENRNINVYLPHNYYEANKRYPVLYMHDGQNVFRDTGAIGGVSLSLENYLNENSLEVIVVAINQNSEERLNEYCPWVNGAYSKKVLGYQCPSGGKGEVYVDFIVHELKPLIDKKYRTLIDHTSIGGISLGGLISVYAVCRYPHIFKKIIAISSAFYRNQEEIEKLIKSSDWSQVESVYLDWGDKEGKGERIHQLFSNSNQSVCDILKEKTPNLTYKIIKNGEHSYKHFKERVPEIFSFLQKT